MGKTAVGVFFMLCYAIVVAMTIASFGQKHLGMSILLNLVLVGGAMIVVYRTSTPKVKNNDE